MFGYGTGLRGEEGLAGNARGHLPDARGWKGMTLASHGVGAQAECPWNSHQCSQASRSHRSGKARDFRGSEDCSLQAPFLSEPQFSHLTNEEVPHPGSHPSLVGRDQGLGQSKEQFLHVVRVGGSYPFVTTVHIQEETGWAEKQNLSVLAEGLFFPQPTLLFLISSKFYPAVLALHLQHGKG